MSDNVDVIHVISGPIAGGIISARYTSISTAANLYLSKVDQLIIITFYLPTGKPVNASFTCRDYVDVRSFQHLANGDIMSLCSVTHPKMPPSKKIIRSVGILPLSIPIGLTCYCREHKSQCCILDQNHCVHSTNNHMAPLYRGITKQSSTMFQTVDGNPNKVLFQWVVRFEVGVSGKSTNVETTLLS